MHDDGDNDDDDTRDEDRDTDDANTEDRFGPLGRTTWRATRRLGLNHAARMLSLLTVTRAFHMEALRNYTRGAKAAMSIFVASHLVGHPLTLEQVSMVTETNQRTILDTYRLFYPERETVIDSEFLLLLGHSSQHARTENLPSLAWPPPAYDEELRTDAFWETIASRLETEPEHNFTLIEVARELVLKIGAQGVPRWQK